MYLTVTHNSCSNRVGCSMSSPQFSTDCGLLDFRDRRKDYYKLFSYVRSFLRPESQNVIKVLKRCQPLDWHHADKAGKLFIYFILLGYLIAAFLLVLIYIRCLSRCWNSTIIFHVISNAFDANCGVGILRVSKGLDVSHHITEDELIQACELFLPVYFLNHVLPSNKLFPENN